MGTLIMDRAVVQNMLDQINTQINSGAIAGALAIYGTGTLGTDDTTVPDGTLLQWIELGDPAINAAGAPSGDNISCVFTAEGTATPVTGGTAVHCAIFFRTNSGTTDFVAANLVCKGDVTTTAGTGFLRLDSTTLTGTGAIDLDQVNCNFNMNMTHTLT